MVTVYVAGERKNTDLFLAQLEALRRRNPTVRRIHLVLDNYVIHSSKRARAYLAKHGHLFQLHFLPPYSPEENRIERLWGDLHANVTRNHRCRTLAELMSHVNGYMEGERRRRRKAERMPPAARANRAG